MLQANAGANQRRGTASLKIRAKIGELLRNSCYGAAAATPASSTQGIQPEDGEILFLFTFLTLKMIN